MLRLNLTEGVPGGAYRPTLLIVDDIHGCAIEAMTNVAPRNPVDGPPSLRYIPLLREDAREQGLPEAWLQTLDGVAPAE
jgi:hypothetical protein